MSYFSEKPTLNILIPVFNEGKNIAATLQCIAESLNKTPADSFITIVYDFDEDDTLPVVESLKSSYPLPIILQKNRGCGVCDAIRHGLLGSRTTFVLVTMADMSDDYEKLPLMLETASNGYDIVCGSRYIAGGTHNGGPFVKKTLSKLAGISLHRFTGLPTHDATNSYKLYRRSILDSITIESRGGFEIGMEIVVKAFAKGLRITEVACNYRDRIYGDSKFRLVRWLPFYLKWYFYAIKMKYTDRDLTKDRRK